MHNTTKAVSVESPHDSPNNVEGTDGAKRPYPNQFRLTIGVDGMSAFAGLSDGDLFRANNRIYRIRPSSGGWTLRPYDNPLGDALPGFEYVPDYTTFVYLVNMAAVNGL